MKRGRRGFWLGEVVVAIGILSIVSLTVIGVFSFLAVTSQTRSEKAAAELLADTLMEQAVTAGPPNWGLPEGQILTEVSVDDAATASGENVDLETGDSQTKEHMAYLVIPEELDHGSLGKLYRVRVRVSWQEPPGPNNVERGRGYLERTRTVYID